MLQVAHAHGLAPLAGLDARRSALEMMFSRSAIVMRTLTPLDWSTYEDFRAWTATISTSSRM